MEALNNLGLNFGTLLVQISGFFLMLIVLRAWVYTPLIGMIEKRRETINQGLEDARVAADARANAEAEAKKIVDESQAKASEIVREATARAEEAARDVKAAADKEAADARKDALAQAEQERNALLGEVRGQVAVLAMSAAQKLIGESLDEKRQRALVDEFFSTMQQFNLADAGEGDAVVTSALPLNDDEQKKVAASLKGEVDFKVDPNILGGLVIRVGDKRLDGSVAGKLDEMRQNLK